MTSLTAPSTATAKLGGVRSPGGVFTQLRVAATASATSCASSKARTNSFLRADGLSTTTSPGWSALDSSEAFFLYAVNA